LNEFDDRFTFTDHALDLEFTEKASSKEFLQKSREQFPDIAVEVLAIFEIGDHDIAE